MIEIFEECSILFKATEGENLNTGIHVVFRGLKFEPDTGIGQKVAFFKDL
jgi:hypothetical protein